MIFRPNPALVLEIFLQLFIKRYLKQCKVFLFYHHSRQSQPADVIFCMFLRKPDTLTSSLRDRLEHSLTQSQAARTLQACLGLPSSQEEASLTFPKVN